MGRQLGLIHQHKCDFFGSMDEHGESLHGFKSLKAYLLHSTSKILTDLHSVEHEDHVLIKRAESLFLTMLDSLEYNPPATLCHHDFGPRNILVSEQRGGYSLRSVIDFEHCVPSGTKN
jgi:Ser/Thr protein kinase RdoA (MazF antagonist)